MKRQCDLFVSAVKCMTIICRLRLSFSFDETACFSPRLELNSTEFDQKKLYTHTSHEQINKKRTLVLFSKNIYHLLQRLICIFHEQKQGPTN